MKPILLIWLVAWIPRGLIAAPPEISVPAGFSVEIYAQGLRSPRGMVFGPDGTLFVGSKTGEVTAIDGEGKPTVIGDGFTQPVGVAYADGDLYVSSISEIYRIPNVDGWKTRSPEKPLLVSNAFPADRHHGWKFIAFGPDGYLYVPVGAPCNVCLEDDPIYASIARIRPDGTGLEIYARGVRNTVGFDWHPDTRELWFTDNGRDRLGDDIPPDELNRADRPGLHFGFPYLHGRGIVDPAFGNRRGGTAVTLPAQELPAHVAALGMRFGQDLAFPDYYRQGIFIAEHGSWNRSSKIGYRVSFVSLAGNRAMSYEIFAEGWMVDEKTLGRPADVEVGPDGALYVSDDHGGTIWRIRWTGGN